MLIRTLTLFLTASSLLVSTSVIGQSIYDDLKIKSRAKRGYSNHGTVIYRHTEIPIYSDKLTSEERGNIHATSRVRRVYNRVNVRSRVYSIRPSLDIGTVTINGGRAAKVIDNKVTIDGSVSTRGHDTEIGTVRVNGGRIKRVNNRTRIKGDIDAN